MSKISVIVAHPDDEVLGCGGTIAKHTREGDEVHVLIMAEGITSRDNERNVFERSHDLNLLAQQVHKANKILQVTSLTLYKFPDNRMDSVDFLDIVKKVESFIKKKQPQIIYTHFEGDLNIDHQKVSQAVVTACRPLPGSLLSTLLFIEVASSTEWQIGTSISGFKPNWHVNISNTLDKKLEALEAYYSEMRNWPHARSIEAVKSLAKWRGANIGVDAAESYILGRRIL